MTNNHDSLGALQSWGEPVQGAVGCGPIIGRDAAGRECIHLNIGLESSEEGGLFVLQVERESGAIRRFDAPLANSGGRAALWSERHQMLFLGASPRSARRGEPGGWLLAFDPRRDAIVNLGAVDARGGIFPMSLAEAADGSIYIGTYGNCGLYRWKSGVPVIEFCGQADTVDHYGYVHTGEDGSVAVLVKMAHPHVMAYDPENRSFHSVGPTADTNAQQGFVEVFKGADGYLYVTSHEGCWRVEGTAGVPVEAAPARAAQATFEDGATARFMGLQPPRYIEVKGADGARMVHRLAYEAAGAEIYLVRPGPDGRVYGSSALPLHFFIHEPATNTTVDHGECTSATGQTYAMDWLDGKLYFSVYTHGILCVYDPQQPYNFAYVREVDGEVIEAAGGDLPGWPCRHRFGPNDNPLQLGRMDKVAYRPRDMVAGPAGKVWVTSMPDYGMWSGTLSWYDPATDTFGGAHRDIIPDCSPQAITWLKDQNLLALGFSIYGGSGTSPRVSRTGFALWDPERDMEVWHGDLGLDIAGVMDMEDAGGGLAYAVVHLNPSDPLHAELMLLDSPRRQVVARAPLSESAGWPLEVTFQRDDRYLYGATRQSVYRVELGTTDIEVLWRDAKHGPTAGGALVGGRYYFGRGAQLSSVQVR